MRGKAEESGLGWAAWAGRIERQIDEWVSGLMGRGSSYRGDGGGEESPDQPPSVK